MRGWETRNLFCLDLWTWFFFKTFPLFVHKNSWKSACTSQLHDIISWQWIKHFWLCKKFPKANFQIQLNDNRIKIWPQTPYPLDRSYFSIVSTIFESQNEAATTLLKYWVYSISLFKMITCHAFYHKNLLIRYKNSNPRMMNKGLISISRETFIFFCSCLCFKRVCKWGKTFKGKYILEFIAIDHIFCAYDQEIHRVNESFKTNSEICFFFYFEMCEKLGRSGDQKLTIN